MAAFGKQRSCETVVKGSYTQLRSGDDTMPQNNHMSLGVAAPPNHPSDRSASAWWLETFLFVRRLWPGAVQRRESRWTWWGELPQADPEADLSRDPAVSQGRSQSRPGSSQKRPARLP